MPVIERPATFWDGVADMTGEASTVPSRGPPSLVPFDFPDIESPTRRRKFRAESEDAF